MATIGQTVGFISGFVCSLFLCVRTKIYIYLGISLISLITCTILFSRNNYFKIKAQIVNDKSTQNENNNLKLRNQYNENASHSNTESVSAKTVTRF